MLHPKLKTNNKTSLNVDLYKQEGRNKVRILFQNNTQYLSDNSIQLDTDVIKDISPNLVE